jgi:phosphoribosylamine--glycine ligase
MSATSMGELSKVRTLEWDSRACVCVVCAAAGYPGNYEKGKVINGLEDAEKIKDVVVFHAGTELRTINDVGQRQEREYLTNGGRVLGVTGLGSTIKDAINKAYQAVGMIQFEGIHCRKDIGSKAIKGG